MALRYVFLCWIWKQLSLVVDSTGDEKGAGFGGCRVGDEAHLGEGSAEGLAEGPPSPNSVF